MFVFSRFLPFCRVGHRVGWSFGLPMGVIWGGSYGRFLWERGKFPRAF